MTAGAGVDEQRLRSLVRDVPDFPKPGVVFKDITPLLADAGALAAAVEAMAGSAPACDVVAGVEARGFLLATPVALALGVGFVPIRKPGKLPWRTRTCTYDLEYGTDSVEVHEDAVGPGARVLLVDDVLATGGTAAASGALLSGLGATVVGLSVLIELGFLDGRARLQGFDVSSVLTF
ncbi:MAG: adenine phosphoribosyltransferase [Acidimicrobiia bacterium]|nr:adenine phosphoribosyltransferase [Acidimicrobiia bacterium]